MKSLMWSKGGKKHQKRQPVGHLLAYLVEWAPHVQYKGYVLATGAVGLVPTLALCCMLSPLLSPHFMLIFQKCPKDNNKKKDNL